MRRAYKFIYGTFQSTLPRGERRAKVLLLLVMYAFQSTLPRGERLFSLRFPSASCRFQSTLPRGERLRGEALRGGVRGFQSTLPRGERPKNGLFCYIFFQVSIHAPTRGATLHAIFGYT